MERNKVCGQFGKNVLRMLIGSAGKFARNFIRFRKTQQKMKGLHESEVVMVSSVGMIIINVTS
jgi:urocanate hydratase